MAPDDHSVLVRIEASLTLFREQQVRDREERRTDIGRLFDKIEETKKEMGEKIDAVKSVQAAMAIDGCARGKANGERITKLEEKPEKIISLGASAIAILAAIKAFFGSTP